MKILNIGSLNLDHVYQVRHFIQPGETDAALDYNIFPGGKGLNQSIAISKAGQKVFHAGAIGRGGEMLESCLNNAGVDCSYTKHTDINQGHAVIQVNRDGENCIIIYPGSNHQIDTAYIDGTMASFGEDTWLVLQNEVNNLDYIINKAYEAGMKIVLNPSPMDEKVSSVDLAKVTWLLLNEVEGESITGKKNPDEILAELRESFPKTNIVMTLGRKGSVCLYKGEKLFQAAFKASAVDTTAAGDTFTGYLVSCLAKGSTIKEALRYASAAAAISVTRKGASASIPTIEEVEAFLAAEGCI